MFTSTWSMLGSVVMSKLTLRFISLPLVWLVEYMYSMLSTPLICCSMGVATDFSSVTASAPGQFAVKSISGGAVFGYCAMGSWAMETRPTLTTRMEMTIATIGQS